MKKQLQKGFTLIELMIVVAIIGILAAIAIPAYQDYIARSQATEAVSLLSGAKTPVAEYFADKGVWPLVTSVAGTTSGKYVANITQDGEFTSGVYTLTATMRSAGVNSRIAGSAIDLSTTNGSQWSCGPGTGTPIEAKYLPAACR